MARAASEPAAGLIRAKVRQQPMPGELDRPIAPDRRARERGLQEPVAQHAGGTRAQRPVRALSRQASIIAMPLAPSSTVGKSSAIGLQDLPAIRAAITSATSL